VLRLALLLRQHLLVVGRGVDFVLVLERLERTIGSE